MIERVATVDGIAPAVLWNELYPFCSESTTARVESVRSPDIIDDWLAAQAATIETAPTCYLADGDAWLHVAAPPDPGWLARQWRAARATGALLILSADARRLLFLLEMTGDALRAVALETAQVVAMRDDRARLDALLAATADLLRVPMPQSPRALRAADLAKPTATYRLGPDAAEARRATWIVDAFARWRAMPPRLDDRSAAPDQLGPYAFSLAGSDPLATFGAYLAAPEVLPRLCGDRLVVINDGHTRALDIAGGEARLVALGGA